MAKKILIVGGGLAGTIVANGLCRQLREELSVGSVAITMLMATATTIQVDDKRSPSNHPITMASARVNSGLSTCDGSRARIGQSRAFARF